MICEETVSSFSKWLDTLPGGEMEFISQDFSPYRAALAGTRFETAKITTAPRALAAAIGRIALERFRAGLAQDPAEIDANCRGVNLDSNRLKECLSRNRDMLSAPCADNYLKTFDAIQKRVAARTAVANACTREIVKLCAGSTKETSKSIPCLTTAQGVSARCIQAMGDAGYR